MNEPADPKELQNDGDPIRDAALPKDVHPMRGPIAEEDASFVERMGREDLSLTFHAESGYVREDRQADLDRLIALAGRAVSVPPAGAPGLSAAELDAIEARIKAYGSPMSPMGTQLKLVVMARASLRGDDRYREGMLRAAEIASGDAWKSQWDGQGVNLAVAAAIRAEANALAPQPDYIPVVIDFPEGGYTELALVDDSIVWDAPVAASLDIGWDAERTKRIAVRWSLAPKPAAAPEVDQLAEDMAAAFAQAIGDPAGWQSCIITLKRVLAAPPAPVPAGEVMEHVEALEAVLRGLASFLGVGGYNADKVDPAVFDRKIREGIDIVVDPWVEDAERYRALRLRGAAPASTMHLKEGLVYVATNLDAWVDALLKDGRGVAPSYAAEGLTAAQPRADAGEVTDALRQFIYETTSLSPEEDDGSHKCKISKACLDQGRAALRAALAAREVQP